ncbi:hypothetical protein ACOCJ7_18405 [Knoellia sp. CPCC 206453]|uniref:hypothetical protein n=1 Tax=Knoellia pratensis TaxID=3404796 RepID=UPI0036084CE7
MGGEDIHYPTAHMRSVASKARTDWEKDAGSTHSTLNGAAAAKDSFGDIPVLAQYGSVFDQVKGIYVKAMEGVKTDLVAVADGITTSAKHTSDKDDEAEAALVALWQKWDRGPLESERQRDEAAATPEAQAAAAATDQAEVATGASPDSETPVEGPATNPDTRNEGAVPTGTGPGHEPPTS